MPNNIYCSDHTPKSSNIPKTTLQKFIERIKKWAIQWRHLDTGYNLQMEDKGNTDDKVASRRSRKDEEGRDFQCGCGKRYLSYPALYTHIKTKHEGRQPQGTLKSTSIKRHKPKFEEDTLRSLYSYLQRSQLRLFVQLGNLAEGKVALSSRIKKDSVPKQVFDSYLSLMRQEGEVKLHSTSSLDLALAVFLLNAGEHFSDKIYQQFLLFARIARGCFFEHAEQVHKVFFSKGSQGSFHLGTFSTQEVKYFPIVCDFAVQSYIPVTYGQSGKEVNLSLMELMFFDFCSWLYTHRLTPIRTAFAKDFQLDYKPPPTKNKHPKQDHKQQNENKEQEEESEQEGSDLQEIQEQGEEKEGKEALA